MNSVLPTNMYLPKKEVNDDQQLVKQQLVPFGCKANFLMIMRNQQSAINDFLLHNFFCLDPESAFKSEHDQKQSVTYPSSYDCNLKTLISWFIVQVSTS